MNRPDVYIILVNWNGKDVTIACLDSLRQVAYPSYTVVVVDNASSDGSVEAIKSRFPEVHLLEQTENLRFAGGNNAAIAYALDRGAAFICLLNNDTTVDTQFLSFLVERLEADANAGMAAPKIYYHDEPQRIWFAGGEISMWTGTMKHTGIREYDKGQHDTPRPIDYATGCCILAKREVVERIGGLDEAFFMYAEDADWSMRARRAGYTVCYEPRARVWHKLSVASGGHLSFFKMKNKFTSNLRFFFRYATLPQKLVFPWMNVIVNALAALRYVLRVRKG